MIGTSQKLTLHPKRPYIRGPYKRAPVYSCACYIFACSFIRCIKSVMSFWAIFLPLKAKVRWTTSKIVPLRTLSPTSKVLPSQCSTSCASAMWTLGKEENGFSFYLSDDWFFTDSVRFKVISTSCPPRSIRRRKESAAVKWMARCDRGEGGRGRNGGRRWQKGAETDERRP